MNLVRKDFGLLKTVGGLSLRKVCIKERQGRNTFKKIKFLFFSVCSTVSGPQPEKRCVFPFTFKRVVHNGCRFTFF